MALQRCPLARVFGLQWMGRRRAAEHQQTETGIHCTRCFGGEASGSLQNAREDPSVSITPIWLREHATRVPVVALVENVDALSRFRCRDYQFFRVLGDELAVRFFVCHAVPPGIVVTLLRAYAGMGCQHRRLFPVLYKALLQSAPWSADCSFLRPLDLVRLAVACGQLQGGDGVAMQAVGELIRRGAAGAATRPLFSLTHRVQLVHAITRIGVLPSNDDPFWEVVWLPCCGMLLRLMAQCASGRDVATVFAAACKLQRYRCAWRVATAAVASHQHHARSKPAAQWPAMTNMADAAMWLGSLALLVGLSSQRCIKQDAHRAVMADAFSALEQTLVISDAPSETSHRRQLVTFALVWHSLGGAISHHPARNSCALTPAPSLTMLPRPALLEMCALLDEFGGSGSRVQLSSPSAAVPQGPHDIREIVRKSRSRLQQEVVGTLPAVLSGRSVGAHVEEACVVYTIDILISHAITA